MSPKKRTALSKPETGTIKEGLLLAKEIDATTVSGPGDKGRTHGRDIIVDRPRTLKEWQDSLVVPTAEEVAALRRSLKQQLNEEFQKIDEQMAIQRVNISRQYDISVDLLTNGLLFDEELSILEGAIAMGDKSAADRKRRLQQARQTYVDRINEANRLKKKLVAKYNEKRDIIEGLYSPKKKAIVNDLTRHYDAVKASVEEMVALENRVAVIEQRLQRMGINATGDLNSRFKSFVRNTHLRLDRIESELFKIKQLLKDRGLDH